MEKRWKILKAAADKTKQLQEALNIHPLLCELLVQRGIETFDQAKKFFRPQLSELNDPWLMKDMDRAVTRILHAIHAEQKILVFGDYDVDGTTSVATLYQFLKKKHDALDFYIPHRYREGYGVSKAGIDFAAANNFSLIISVDCGIKSTELIAYANALGIDFIICDHHLPDEVLPEAVAILNPKQHDCNYPYKELCGCGVVFKLIQALAPKLNLTDRDVFEFLDLVATAVAADIVPLMGENRILAFHGLEKANRDPNKGIKALIKLSALTGTLEINNLVFMIAPRVNAAGRMDDAKKAVLLFIAETEEEALEYAKMLHSDNTDRKEADVAITAEALELIRSNPVWIERKSTLVFRDHWHKGVVGIVASRLIEHYHRPTIVLTKSGDYVAGSARSVPGFNLYEAIHACREHLLGYGGHFAAAGMTLEPGSVDAFRERFEEIVAGTIHPDMLIPELLIDAEIRLKDIRWPFYNILQQMEPFGPENPRPLFVAKGVMNTGYSKIVKEQHIRFSVTQDNVLISGIGFGLAEKFHLLEMKSPVDIVFRIDVNEWNGEKHLQIRVVDLRLTMTVQ